MTKRSTKRTPYYIADDWHCALRGGDLPDFGVYRRGRVDETPIATFASRTDARKFCAMKNGTKTP